MSEELNIQDEVYDLCDGLKVDPSLVRNLAIDPQAVTGYVEIPTEFVRDEIRRLCLAAGFDANSVKAIQINPKDIRFEIYVEPKQYHAEGALTVFVTKPWGRG